MNTTLSTRERFYDTHGERALIIFEQVSIDAHWASRFLKEGFNHVWCILEREGYWVRYEFNQHYPVVRVECASDFDLAAHYRPQVTAVVELNRRSPRPQAYLLNNCVGHTKLLCGIRSRAWTPWQLYKDLTA